ncbi:cytochrome c family protein [Alphaproteobacteria bacterium]|nr:cytochrome c family protein [Alphaproteobacteria bacterium]
MDTYILNKYGGALIAAILVIFLLGKLGDIVVHPKKLEKQVYSSEPLLSDSSKVASNSNKPIEEIPLPVLLASASVEKGKKVARKCASCHGFEKGGANKVGPNLYNVLGAPMASVSGFTYSSAIKKVNAEWGYKELNLFLINPKTYIKGTKMAFAGLKKPSDRANIIAYLRESTDNPPPLPDIE